MSCRTRTFGPATRSRSRLDSVLDQGIRKHFSATDGETLPLPKHVQKAYDVIQQAPWSTMSVAAATSTPTEAEPVAPLNLRAVIGGSPSSYYTEREKRNCRWRSQCIGGVCFCATVTCIAALLAWLLLQPDTPLSSPPPASTASDRLGEYENGRLREYACVDIASQSDVLAPMSTHARRLVTGRRRTAFDIDALRGAMVKLLPGGVQPAHVKIIDQGDNCRVCVAEGPGFVSDDILDAMLEDRFPGLVANELGVAGVDLVTPPTIAFTEALASPPPMPLSRPSPVPSPLLPLSTPPTPLLLRPGSPPQRSQPSQSPSQQPPRWPSPGRPPQPPSPPFLSPSELQPPKALSPEVVILVHGGSDTTNDDSVTDVVVWSNTPTTVQFSGGHQVYEFDYVFWTEHSHTECMHAPIHLDFSGYLDADLRTSINVNPGIYFLCLRQGPRVTKHARIRLIAQHPPLRSPPPKPLPSPPLEAPAPSPSPPSLPMTPPPRVPSSIPTENAVQLRVSTSDNTILGASVDEVAETSPPSPLAQAKWDSYYDVHVPHTPWLPVSPDPPDPLPSPSPPTENAPENGDDTIVEAAVDEETDTASVTTPVIDADNSFHNDLADTNAVYAIDQQLVAAMDAEWQPAVRELARTLDLDDHWSPWNLDKRAQALRTRAAREPLWGVPSAESPDERI